MFPILQWSKEPPKTTPEASFTITGDSWGSPKWIPSPGIPEHSITAVALECSEMGPPEAQTHPASTDTGTWTSFERLLPEKIVKSVTSIHGTSLRNYHTLLKLPRPYRFLNLCTATRRQKSSWMGLASAPAWAVHKGQHLMASACPEQPLTGPWTTVLHFLFHLFPYFCKRDWDLAAVNVIWAVWLLFNSQLSLSQAANSQLITASQQIQSLHQAREF